MRAQNTSAGMANVIAGFAAIVFFTGTAATASAAAPAGKLSPEQIQSTFFDGKPFTAATTSNVKFKMTFSADGKMKREPAGGGGGKGEGTWKLSKEGFCSAWKGAGTNCFIVVAAGDNKWSVLKGSTILATWSK
jgi:hypothetical protein